MEYLPEKKRTQKSQVLKKEDKTRKFREYLANNDVVLSMVKCKSSSHLVIPPQMSNLPLSHALPSLFSSI
jgi:hypothetical protein